MNNRMAEIEIGTQQVDEMKDLLGAETPTGMEELPVEATIVALAALPPLEYDQQREAQAEKLGCRITTLDKLVEEKRVKRSDALQGGAVGLSDVVVWPESVDGAAVLSEVAERFARFVALPEGGANLLALWCAHAHMFEVFICSPRLNIKAPEWGCGKTTLRDVVALFVPRPLLTENLTVAVLFRLVDARKPVVLADEYDTWLKDNEELRGLLNAGHRHNATVYRCEGDDHEVREFKAFTPAVLCGIGALPGTLHDRSIVLNLTRAKPGELRAKFDPRYVEGEQELCRKLARWGADNRERIAKIDPALPESAYNRLADNWRPLFAIAEAAGGDWSERCADAFQRAIGRHKDDDTESLRVMLLADMRQVWTEQARKEGKPVERMFSRDIVVELQQLSERPWLEVRHGKAINDRWLAQNLRAFSIHSRTMRIGKELAKGYELADCQDVFARYLPTV